MAISVAEFPKWEMRRIFWESRCSVRTGSVARRPVGPVRKLRSEGGHYDLGSMLTNKNEVLAAALDQTNTWLAQTLGRSDLQLQLISQPIARTAALQFERGGGRRRKVHWNWEELFFSKVRHQDAWMYAMVRAGRPRAMCYGRIQVKGGHVSLDYLERTPYARGIRGLTAPTAFQFARAVALLLDLTEVRLNEPFPHLVHYYEKVLGEAVRHPAVGPVKYLSVKVTP
jgi:hypothetical protein